MSATRPAPLLSPLLRAGSDLARAVRGRAGRPRPRTVAMLAAVLVVTIAGWFWLRDSSLVAVRTVEVSGISGAQAPLVRAALEEAGHSMTTLHVRKSALETAVAPFSIVKDVEVSTGFPHTLRIHVVTNVAVGAVVVDGRRLPVTSDGTLLRDVRAGAGLPTIPLRVAPGGRRLTDRAALVAVATLGTAPAPLRGRVNRVFTTRAHGLGVQLAHGPLVWFGDGTRLAAKWAAAAAVLADSAAAGASSIDVTVPERPAVGGLPGGVTSGESDVPTPPAGSTTAAASPAAGATTPVIPPGGSTAATPASPGSGSATGTSASP